MKLDAHFWLINAYIPACLLDLNNHLKDFQVFSNPLLSNSANSAAQISKDGLVACDLEIRSGKIITISPANFNNNSQTKSQSRQSQATSIQTWDAKSGIVLPCFVDMHTHLDKGHIWERSPNLDGTFAGALSAVSGDSSGVNSYDDIYRRMEFGLKSSFALGTKAIRTHIDCPSGRFELSLQVFVDLQIAWRDRLILQAASLVTLNDYAGKNGEILADKIADLGGILGGVAYQNPNLEQELDRLFALAKARNLNLDLHTDENNDPGSQTLKAVAKAALRHDFTGNIVCGHCCSLAIQDTNEVNETLELVKSAKIGIVSLPMCNLYLQDRQFGRTPRWRGITLIHEIAQAGIPVAIASDNVRDPFFGFGNHDGLEVFATAVKIAHLDTPYSDWIKTITTTPAALMGSGQNHFFVGASADLVIFKARYFSELLSRPQTDRVVLRNGEIIASKLPDYAELD